MYSFILTGFFYDGTTDRFEVINRFIWKDDTIFHYIPRRALVASSRICLTRT